VRYFCAIYTHQYTLTGTQSCAKGEPGPDALVARVVVSGGSQREAAARAYVQCVGRERARQLQEERRAPRHVARQETNSRAIAASLRKTTRTAGTCYLMDNLVEGWSITVEPLVPMSRTQPRPHSRPCRLRLPQPIFAQLSRSPSPN
jgi:hypothetical protein